MPYIKKEQRKEMNEVVECMKKHSVEPDGRLNYVLYKFCLDTVGQEPSYNKLKNFCGELEECVTEIRRRITAKYEDKKIIENGDVGNVFMTVHHFQDFNRK